MSDPRFDRFGPVARRDFRQAVVHLLETEYKLVGSHRVLRMIAEDIAALVEQYYPPTERLRTGQLVWVTTADTGQKAHKGKRAEEYPQVTIIVPWVTPEEVTGRQAPSPGKRFSSKQANIARLVRVVKAAKEAGGLLTAPELALLFNVSAGTISDWMNEHYRQSGEVLPTKAVVMDMGRQPSHKDIIVHLYEQKKDPAEIARQTKHHQDSVDRYLRDYQRVKTLLGKGLATEEISYAMSLAVSTIREYEQLVWHYHPELKPPKVDGNGSNPVKTCD
jgi:hypothetical protein